MQQVKHIIKSRSGMHTRPAMEIFHLAHDSSCFIEVTCNGRTLHAKMVMDMMSLSARIGDEITFQIIGDDEEKVARKLKTLCEKLL